MKIIVAAFMCFFSISSFACSNAEPTNSPTFCTSFKTAASCHCVASGLPPGMCQDMKALFNRMIVVFGSLQKACEYQHHTTTQDCIDNWNCQRLGGVNSQNQLCSGTGRACS